MMTPTLTRVVALAGALLLAAAPASAQNVPEPDIPLACVTGITRMDQTRVLVCDFPNGDQLATLAEPAVSGHPLLYYRVADGTVYWAPIGRRYLPQAWTMMPGDDFTTVRLDAPRCPVLVETDPTVYLAALPNSTFLAVATDGSVACTW
jgi:hypothetical protein